MGPPGHSGEVERTAANGKQVADQPVFVRLASAYLKEGLLVEAIRICRAGLALHPGHAGGRTVLACALLEQGSLDDAEAEFRRVLEQAPENAPALRCLGEISAKRGRVDEARRYYVQTLRLEPDDSGTQDRLAALAVTWGDRVVEPADQARRENRDPLASQTLASLYASQGHGDVAEVIYSLIGGRQGESPPTATPGKVSARDTRASLVLGRLLALREAARNFRGAEGTERKAGQKP